MRRCTNRRLRPVMAVWSALAVAVVFPMLSVPAVAQEPDVPTRTQLPLERVSPVLRQAWDAFQSRYGDDWHVDWDMGAAVPGKLYGPGVDMTEQPLDATLVDALARSFLDENRGLYRLDPAVELRGAASLHGSVWYLNYNLTRGPLPLDEASRVDFRFKPNGVLAMIAAYHLPRRFEASLDADVPADAAVRLAEATLPATGGPYVTKAAPVLQIRVNKEAIGQMVWRFELRNNRGDLPIARDFSVHAVGDGDILESRNRIFEVDVTGNVQANTHVGNPATAVVPQNLPNVAVSIVGGASTTTDANGNFTIPNPGTAPVTVRVGTTTTAYSGAFAATSNQAGANTVFTTSATPGTPLNVVLNGTPSEFTNAQADAYLQTNLGHDFMRSVVGETFGLGHTFTVNVNLAQTCNAYYDGASTNFFQSGGGCNNTAFDSVVRHEYGHAVDDGIQGITDGALTEGVADTISMYSLNDPIVGRSFFTNGNIIRDGNNARQWPASECSGQVHCVGETFMGFTWKSRVNLINTLGTGPGTARADQIVLQALFGNGPGIPDQVMDTYVQDDDDGNLNNGVPDQVDLDAAADFHNLPHPRPLFITINHTPLPTSTTNSSVPFAVVATITTTSGSINSSTLFYSVNGAAFQNVAMAPTANPNEFSASIPAQSCGSTVAYYIQASDTASHTERLPSDAPASAFSFFIGVIRRFFFDDFEIAGDNGWTHASPTGTQDDWQHGVPNQQGSNPWDPTTAFSGTRVWGNDLNPPGFNGSYANSVNNRLDSPSINASGHTGVHLRYRRWLTVEDGVYDHARVLVNGNIVWENPPGSGSTPLIDTSWVDHDVDISAIADNNASVVVRYSLETDAGLTFGGWNVDDVSLEEHATAGSIALSLSNSNPPIGTPVTLTFTGTPNAGVFLLLARFTGSASFAVPNGPTVTTGLSAPLQVRVSSSLNATGSLVINRTVPNRPVLQGRQFALQAVLNVCSGAVSNILPVTIQ